MSKTSYKSMNSRSEGLYKEKGSKFIGIAQPCYSEDEVKELLKVWKKEHQQAEHLCYAYRLGFKADKYRANDDGEPSNSAGAPILGQLQSYDLTNTLIGVVRYYGGTKLGVGGLINAYRTAAKEAIDAGKIVEKEVMAYHRIHFEYPDMSTVMVLLKQRKIDFSETQFEESCALTVALSLDEEESCLDELEYISSVKTNHLSTH